MIRTSHLSTSDNNSTFHLIILFFYDVQIFTLLLYFYSNVVIVFLLYGLFLG